MRKILLLSAALLCIQAGSQALPSAQYTEISTLIQEALTHAQASGRVRGPGAERFNRAAGVDAKDIQVYVQRKLLFEDECFVLQITYETTKKVPPVQFIFDLNTCIDGRPHTIIQKGLQGFNDDE